MRRRAFLCGPVLLGVAARHGRPPLAAVERYERETGGHVGFYAEHCTTGASLGWRARERFVMCSTFKASLAALVLRRVDRRRDGLDDRIAFGPSDLRDWYAPVARANVGRGSMTVREMCAAAVEVSDNTCASLLLSRVGGPPALTAFWRSVGDRTSRLDDVEPYLNRTPPGGVRNTTTPAAMAETLKSLTVGDGVLTASSRRILTGWLDGCTTGSDRLRAGLPASWTTGDKTGNNGKDAAGDIAVTRTPSSGAVVLTAYTRGGSPSDRQLADAFSGIARYVAATLGGGER